MAYTFPEVPPAFFFFLLRICITIGETIPNKMSGGAKNMHVEIRRPAVIGNDIVEDITNELQKGITATDTKLSSKIRLNFFLKGEDLLIFPPIIYPAAKPTNVTAKIVAQEYNEVP